jgi:D-glycero-D-manno-heptose 1,7-bisphosphate phosphatase
MKKPAFNNNWSLFLDRDGVINQRLPGQYICTPEQFEFINGVPEAIAGLSKIFSYLVIVTNQQGIAKGLMTEKDLQAVHEYMLDEIGKYGGRIDAIYYCPALESDNHAWRKPNTGMALAARDKLPGIRFRQSLMVGDSHSDMEFASKLGISGVLVGSHENVTENTPFELRFESLPAFYRWIIQGE